MRNTIAAVHAVAILVWVLVVGTGRLTVPGFLLWLALCAAGDQALVWALWLGSGRKGPSPNRRWR